MNSKRFASTIFLCLIALTSFALSKDSLNAVTMESYEQGWLDSDGTLALKNNTNEDIHNVTFQISYLNMAGKPLDYEVYTKEVDIAPGMTRQIDIPAYEHERNFSYYKSEAMLSTPHKFKIKYELKGYNQETKSKGATKLASDDGNDDNSGLYVVLAIVIAIFAIGFCIGLYVLVAVMARKRNRSQVLWVLVALFTTPILAIIILLCIGKSYDDSMPIE